MTQENRIKGGQIDRTKTLRFTFDGHPYTGHPGDTLASALLANGVRLMGRSFKYHRPRGPLSAGSEEPNAIVELRTGAAPLEAGVVQDDVDEAGAKPGDLSGGRGVVAAATTVARPVTHPAAVAATTRP